MEASYVFPGYWAQKPLTGQLRALDDTDLQVLQLLDGDEPHDVLQVASAGRLTPASVYAAIQRLLDAGLILADTSNDWPRLRYRLNRDALRELLRPEPASEPST